MNAETLDSSLIRLLLHSSAVSQEQATQALNTMTLDNRSAPDALIANHVLSSASLAEILSGYFKEPLSNIGDYPYVATCEKLDKKSLCLNHTVLPLLIKDAMLYLGVSDPTDLNAQDEFRFATGLMIKPVILEHQQLQGALRKLYGKNLSSITPDSSSVSDSELEELAEFDNAQDVDELATDEAPVSRYIQQVILDAVRKQASDIHFEPFEDTYRIRFRLDGMLQLHSSPPAGISRRLSTRLKILAKLNIAERRMPQDGRIKLTLSNTNSIDMRVSTLPTLWGEKVVLRILDSGSVGLDIDKLGYNEKQKADYLSALDKPQGMILMTGPTGSGKTVSLYTGLKYLNTDERNISTAENPVEINLPGINQVNINNDIGLDFAKALRAFLRQDPDVVMVGEIRDLETAEIGIKAAQTGHLVLSTLHTNSAVESINRLVNMGVAPYNLAASLSLVIAQRLARRLCVHCKEPHFSDDQQLSALQHHYPSLKRDSLFTAKTNGCDRCNNGYLGRVGIYEVMKIDNELAEAIGQGATPGRLQNIATSSGTLSLQEAGIEKLNEGITSLTELQRVISL